MKKLRLPLKYANKENLDDVELSMLKFFEDYATSVYPPIIIVFDLDHGTDFEGEE